MREIKEGSRVIDTQLENYFESGSGFREVLTKIFGNVPGIIKHKTSLDLIPNSAAEATCFVDSVLESSCTCVYTPVLRSDSPRKLLSADGLERGLLLKASLIDTVLGFMLAIADDNALYLLEFVHTRGLEKEIARLRARGFAIIPGNSAPLDLIREELANYFTGELTKFQTPCRFFGSKFQQQVWQALCDVPYGSTKSYKEQAVSLNRPNAFRAVANANGANQLAIIIPCHRIIASNGTLGGYGGGLAAKKWLLEHEKAG